MVKNLRWITKLCQGSQIIYMWNLSPEINPRWIPLTLYKNALLVEMRGPGDGAVQRVAEGLHSWCRSWSAEQITCLQQLIVSAITSQQAGHEEELPYNYCCFWLNICFFFSWQVIAVFLGCSDRFQLVFEEWFWRLSAALQTTWLTVVHCLWSYWGLASQAPPFVVAQSLSLLSTTASVAF